MRIGIPYGAGALEYDFGDARILMPRTDALRSGADGRALVEAALAAPIGAKPLAELAAGKADAVVIISDLTRPVPSREILPAMLRALRNGNPAIRITLLVATGCHRAPTRAELEQKLGAELMREHIEIHDAFDPAQNVRVGTLPSGAPLELDRRAAQTELLVAEGFIEPHFFAGFSGGRKSVLPGICGRGTVYGNHCGAFIDHPAARTGVLAGNPIHRDMTAAARMAKLAFIVNAVIDEQKRTVAVFAGDFEAAHAAGVSFLRPYFQVTAEPADIAVTGNGGRPLDQNLYQCVKSMTAAEAAAKEGGTIIVCAELADGVGGEGFFRDLSGCGAPAELYERFCRTPQAQTVPDQWQSQILCRVLMHHPVIVVTRPEMAQAVRAMKMAWAPSLDAAMRMAGGGSVNVIPNGVSVIVRTE